MIYTFLTIHKLILAILVFLYAYFMYRVVIFSLLTMFF
jgi:hypothetical protein